jgi:hypothetical protein
MTNDDYSKVPPPHLLKKFSEQARVDSQKRGHAGYCKTFAKLCIDWALDSKSSPNDCQIRSCDITPPPELVKQWREQAPRFRDGGIAREDWLMTRAAQWGADQELEACCEWLHWQNLATHPELIPSLRAARRPKPQTLNSIALQMLGTIEREAHYLPEITDTIRRALNQLPDS